MSIRMLALDLYKAQQEVDNLQAKLQAAATMAEKEGIEQELRLARRELQVLRKMLDGKKESGSSYQRFSSFGGGGFRKP